MLHVARYQAFVLILIAIVGLLFWFVLPSWSKESSDQMLARGQLAMRAGDVATADQLVNQLSVLGYGEHAALLRGEILFRKREFGRAESELVRVDGQSALYPQAACLYAHCRLEAGDVALAEGLLKGLLEKNADDIEAHRGMAHVYFMLGANRRVVEELEIVARLDPTDTRPWMYKGGFYADVGLLSESIDAYEQAVARSVGDEQQIRAVTGLAESLLKFGQHARALSALDRLSANAQAEPVVRALQADALLRQGSLSAAREKISPLVSAREPSPSLLTIAGRIELEAGQLEQAIRHLRRAAEDPSQYEAHYHLAQALERAGLKMEAENRRHSADLIKSDLQQMSQLTDVAGLKPWDRAVREKLAEISRRLGKREIAEKWRSAARMCPPRS